MEKATASARLHVLLAREANVGLVIRRGPSKQVCTLLWDRKKDTFALGQWLKGRIYERRSDLSPDGKHFLYFAMDGRRSRKGPPCWTAISRAPWLRALVLYGEEETYLGGGQFIDNQTYSVNKGFGSRIMRESEKLKEKVYKRPEKVVKLQDLSPDDFPYPVTGDLGTYIPRLLRDGWSQIPTTEKQHYQLEKPIGQYWNLQKYLHPSTRIKMKKGTYEEDHQLIHTQNDLQIQLPHAEWADLDHRRLVWAQNGQLWAGRLDQEGLKDTKMLHDFNAMIFEEIRAPYG